MSPIPKEKDYSFPKEVLNLCSLKNAQRGLIKEEKYDL